MITTLQHVIAFTCYFKFFPIVSVGKRPDGLHQTVPEKGRDLHNPDKEKPRNMISHIQSQWSY